MRDAIATLTLRSGICFYTCYKCLPDVYQQFYYISPPSPTHRTRTFSSIRFTFFSFFLSISLLVFLLFYFQPFYIILLPLLHIHFCITFCWLSLFFFSFQFRTPAFYLCCLLASHERVPRWKENMIRTNDIFRGSCFQNFYKLRNVITREMSINLIAEEISLCKSSSKTM